MVLKILAIGDSTSNIYLMKKFAKNIEIHLIDFPKKGVDQITTGKDKMEYFDSLLISKQVKKIKEIKDQFDLCIATPWAGSRIAYLAGINYIMYFVGNDITTPPFSKENKKYNYFEKYFYQKILKNAIVCVAGHEDNFLPLKKYRNDAIRLDRVFVDTEIFNEKIQPRKLEKTKFTFLSAQRVGLEKGIDKIWSAIELCKSDFEILQVKWFIEDTTVEEFNELNSINHKLVNDKPDKVRFIPLIKRNELGGYFSGVDAVIGQMRSGIQGGIEREAAFCKKPVICFTDPKKYHIINGEKVVPPFLPQSNEPNEIAKIIDQIVESKQFRDDLAEKEYQFTKNTSDPELVSQDWEDIFTKLLNKKKNTIDRKLSIFERLYNYIILRLEKKYIKKFREKNIQVWGKEEYERLTRG